MPALRPGLGIGWRPEIAGVLGGLAGLGFCEIIAESVPERGRAGVVPPRGVAELRERGVAVVPHGARLSLGGTDPVDPGRAAHLAACAAAVGAPLVSEHVAFVRAGGRDAGHLLPVPRTREALDVLTRNVRRVQAELDVPLALEPIAALLDWPDDELTEGEFLTALLDRTGALLLLDVANVYANAVNRSLDPEAVLDTLPLDRIAYIHVAGGAVRDGLYHDTHTDAVPPAVLGLLARLRGRVPAVPVMLERDGRYPPAAVLRTELDAIAAAARLAGASDPASRDIRYRESGHPVPRVGRSGPASRDNRSGESGDPVRPGPAAPGAGRGVRDDAVRHLLAVPVADVPEAPPPSVLADRQAALVESLVGDGADPPGVDADRLDATRNALLRKRAAAAGDVWPLLAASCGADWPITFARHAREQAGPLREGWDVARALAGLGTLAPAAQRELAAREVTHRYDGASAPRGRWLPAARRVDGAFVLGMAGRCRSR